MRILVTGASGLLGINLSLVAAEQGNIVFGWVHSRQLQGAPFNVRQMDLTNIEAALNTLALLEPEAIIHCAAIADLNVAEKAPELAKRLNSEIPGHLAAAASGLKIPFIHISTDAVFDGQEGNYLEEDATNPLSVYAQTKLAGEKAVLEANPEGLIARVVFYGWSLTGKRSLSEFFYYHLQAGNPVKGFTDTYFCPLYVEDLGSILLEMLTARLKGIYHVVSPESLSKYEFGVRIAQHFGFDPGLIEPVRMASLNREAPRALNLTLKPDKTQDALGRLLPSVDDGIEKFFQRWQSGYPQKLQGFVV